MNPRSAGTRHELWNIIMSRTILMGLGCGFVFLGVIGIVLPIVPTTPFLILAAACFAKSSPRLHGWLLANRIFGPMLRNWQESRTIPRRAKWMATIMVLLVGTVSFLSLDAGWLRVLLVALLAPPLVLVLWLPVTGDPGPPAGE